MLPNCSAQSAKNLFVSSARKTGMKAKPAIRHLSRDLDLKAGLPVYHSVLCANSRSKKMQAATTWPAGFAGMNGAGFVVKTTICLIVAKAVHTNGSNHRHPTLPLSSHFFGTIHTKEEICFYCWLYFLGSYYSKLLFWWPHYQLPPS